MNGIQRTPDVRRFPTLEFHGDRFLHKGGSRWAVTGALSPHGVTRTVTLDTEYRGRGADGRSALPKRRRTPRSPRRDLSLRLSPPRLTCPFSSPPVPENGPVSDVRHVLVLPDRDAAEEAAEALGKRFGIDEEPRLVRDALAGEDDAEDAQWLVVLRDEDERLDPAELDAFAGEWDGWREEP